GLVGGGGGEDEVAAVVLAEAALVEDEGVVGEHAPVVEDIVEAVGMAGGEQHDDATGVVGEVLAEELFFAGVEAALGGGDDDERGVVGDGGDLGDVEEVELEVAQAELVVEGGEAAGGIDVGELHL